MCSFRLTPGLTLILALSLLSCSRPRPLVRAPIAPAEHEPAADSPAEAADFFRKQAVGWESNELIPVERYEAARRQALTLRRFSVTDGRHLTARSATPTFGAWEFLGPGNVGGRTRA